jgi:hypothetical protein
MGKSDFEVILRLMRLFCFWKYLELRKKRYRGILWNIVLHLKKIFSVFLKNCIKELNNFQSYFGFQCFMCLFFLLLDGWFCFCCDHHHCHYFKTTVCQLVQKIRSV